MPAWPPVHVLLPGRPTPPIFSMFVRDLLSLPKRRSHLKGAWQRVEVALMSFLQHLLAGCCSGVSLALLPSPLPNSSSSHRFPSLQPPNLHPPLSLRFFYHLPNPISALSSQMSARHNIGSYSSNHIASAADSTAGIAPHSNASNGIHSPIASCAVPQGVRERLDVARYNPVKSFGNPTPV